ncbi:metal-sensitive transcriptional regulator [Rhodococcus opacus]|uniref:metal-sensitive transcriptional regulator n=1 Tax=Rhodococcus opacus TaxID=37919 RepID=UPI002948C928|nr:metal-sensitive transcriptional regulator [Rhodococcus opacus]MDV6245417.1 metal-sensitive transcriptional regulator [Rhodococcus opacus]
MEHAEADAATLRRLRRAQGQLTAVITMLGTGRELREVVIQLAAASHALHRASFKIISDQLRRCVLDEQDASCVDRLTEEKLEELFLGLA